MLNVMAGLLDKAKTGLAAAIVRGAGRNPPSRLGLGLRPWGVRHNASTAVTYVASDTGC